MRRQFILLSVAAMCAVTAMAQNVTIEAQDRPAEEVFKQLMSQTGKNFIYSSDILSGVRVNVKADKKPLKKVLRQMFEDTDIEYRIKGDKVMLKKKKAKKHKKKIKAEVSVVQYSIPDTVLPRMLDEVEVVSRLDIPAVYTVEIGAQKLTASDINDTPVLFGEADVVKTLQLQPGVSDGVEGMAGMHVHGGDSDENLFMLDNVPLYQANHFAGLFSPFNVDAVKHIDFYKSSFPARYDGRVSSVMDVRTIDGNTDGHHGSVKLGLISGAFNINGPIGRKTTYSVALRRSWYDVLTIPLFAIISAKNEDDNIKFNYSFLDLNAKITHRFSRRSSGFASFYFGNDRLIRGEKHWGYADGYSYEDNTKSQWGNLVAQVGFLHYLSDVMTAEFTVAFTRFFSGMRYEDKSYLKKEGITSFYSEMISKYDNAVNDWIGRGDFKWEPNDRNVVRFGGGYTFHSYRPARNRYEYDSNGTILQQLDTIRSYSAHELNAYIEDDWKVTDRLRANAGLHLSMFNTGNDTFYGVSPRLSISYRVNDMWAVKSAYSRMVQYSHQLSQSYLSLPTDQWIPVGGGLRPEIADKVSAGVYWQSDNGGYSAYIEGYWKEMRNIVDYSDYYYVRPENDLRNSQLTSGRGTAKGIDVKFSKNTGKITGHVAYSLAWADRTYAEKNDGRPYPAYFDNRHTINVLLNWNISDKVSLNAAWTGHSGNRITFATQVWRPECDLNIWDDIALKTTLNNYQLPFYHRLDLSLTVKNRRGYWNFSIYNAYCNMNTIGIRYGSKEVKVPVTASGVTGSSVMSIPVFQKITLLPIIPSFSYTWLF